MEAQAIDFWKRVNFLIKSQGTKQQTVSESCNIPYQTFRGWVTRQVYPDALQSYKIATLLNTSVEYLITGENPVKPDISELEKTLNLALQQLKAL